MIGALAVLLIAAQDPDLVAARTSQTRRVEAIGRCAPAVCSVMDRDAPGGGSGVIFDPAGFVLTNYHVVGEPDTARKKAPVLPLGDEEGEEPPPTEVLPPVPDLPADVLAAWKREHPDADEDEQKKFSDAWQSEWRAQNHPKGKHHYRHKKIGLPDGELYEAVVLGIDPGSDLAVLRLLPKFVGQTWPYCDLGDSDALLVGETVFAMGNPFLLATDFTPTVTFGIVSGTHRYQEGQGNRILVYPDCIQIDAPVNPGNSGGPLFNERGEIVGINGRISIGDRGRVNVGVGFAIASNQVKNFLGDLIAGRHAEHGTLDMSAWYMNSRDTDDRKIPRRGVFVQQMFKDSVVAAHGVSLGDEITQFNGERVRTANQLATLVGVLPAGAWVSLGYRPVMGDAGYGDEKLVAVRLAALDTGSSADTKADTQRLASLVDRRLATAALVQRFVRNRSDEGVTLELTAPDGTAVRMQRRGDRLRVDLGGVTLVRVAPDDCFRVADGVVATASAEERVYLEREFATNPMLWATRPVAEQLGDGILDGGTQVLGAPAYRFDLTGEGEKSVILLRDGAPGGYIMRDPLRRRRVEYHFHGGEVRVVVDGAIEGGWHVGQMLIGPIDDGLFRRPS